MSVRTPRLKPGRDIKSLPLKPAEAFLISRIDGVVNEQDLATLTGLTPTVVAGTLDRLRSLGVIDFGPEDAKQPQRPQMVAPSGVPHSEPQRPTPSAGPHSDPKASSAQRTHSSANRPPPYDPSELDEPAELSIEKKRRILDLFHALEDRTYYELLGVTTEADKKQIKSAYYGLAPEFHPDSYFRKNLGAFKHKIEAIFAAITLAHDVLTSKQKRADYDAYIVQTRNNRRMANMMENTLHDIAQVESAVDESARALVDHQSFSSAGQARAPVQKSIAVPVLTVEERRRILARKLSGVRRIAAPRESMGSNPNDGPTSSPPPSSGAEALKARYEAARAEALRIHVERHTEIARSALAQNDYAAAANAYRIASSLAPDDPQVQKDAAHVLKLAAQQLSEGYLKQAHYEASHGRWSEAALNYARVCEARPTDAELHERVAYATLQSGGNIRRAVEFARKAVELAHDSAEIRLTLVMAYLSAGMTNSAAAELDRAGEFAKNDARMRERIAQLREQAKKSEK